MLFAEAVISHSLGRMTVECEMRAVVVFAQDFSRWLLCLQKCRG